MLYPIDKITTLLGAHRYGEAKGDIAFLLTDSRSLRFPSATLFFAICTRKKDGHDFIPHLYSRGVRNFCVSSLPAGYEEGMYRDANFLRVPSPLKALQRLAERHRDELQVPVVGITGSNGKTVVKEWLNKVLCSDMRVARSPRSYNSQIGVPLSVWLMNADTQIGLFEAGISQKGEMAALESIIQPTIAVVTSIGGAHQENFASMEEKCREKLKLCRHARHVIFPADNDVISREIDKGTEGRCELLGWSMKDSSAPMYIKKVEKLATTTRMEYVFKGREGDFEIPFIDEASLMNAVSVATTALCIGVQPEVLTQRMKTLEPVSMRLEVKEGRNGLTLINDAYNSDVNSLDIALDFMRRRPDHLGRKRTLILSDIQQSGMERSELYTQVAAMLKTSGVDRMIGIGREITAAEAVFRDVECYFFDSTEDFLSSALFRNLKDEVVLIKGAREFGFERITDHTVKKVHETTLEVNLRALTANLDYYRTMKQPGTRMVCMIKADAYGAGAVEVAKTLQDAGVDYLAVAVADEGVTLRNNGISAGIMVMNPEMNSFHTLFEYNLEPEVYSFRLLRAMTKAAQQEGVGGFPIHVKIDTGMHRLGFSPTDDMDELIDVLKSQSALVPRSVFSHFVGSDSDAFDNFSAQQFSLFKAAADKLQSAFPHKILQHICNSAGITHFPERQLDMCRLGIGLYGVDPQTNGIINNVSTLKTTILQLRHVKASDTVGYSRKGVLGRDSVIGAIPIGYADGLNRRLGNGNCYCLVNGHAAPYVGNICMDVAMVDLTGIPCQEGDSVEIFGNNLPVTVLSDALGTIPYEVLTSISNRVKRIYYYD